ncbi:MAG: efflux RND transporter periplasmic adaptor subunit [Saprospiraceae bacterium]|nr:efflux RND transporter periplasmic adaptor subunit [Saprospiraceae bacterium]
MRNITLLLIGIFLLTSCEENPTASSQQAEGLEAKRALLQEKMDQLRSLSREISQLEAEIAELNPQKKDRPRRLVTTRHLQREHFERFVEVQGAVKADDLVDVSPEVTGRLLSLKVKEGDPVKKNQLVAELDLEQLSKQIAELETSLDLARTVFERQSRLWEKNIGSEMQYLEAKNNKERLEKSLETLRFQLSKSKVYAPISGVVETKILQPGELAAAGAPIIKILNTRRFVVEADVPENYLRDVRYGQTVTIEFPALESEQQGRIGLVGHTIHPDNRTFNIEVEVTNRKGLLKPNLLAGVFIKEYEKENAIVVPLEIVQQEVDGKDYLFIKDETEDGPIARKVYIRTGQSYEGSVVVEEGLDGDEEIIVEGARGLADQERIEVKNPKTASNE